MSKPWEINAKRVLVFSDVHQDVEWARAVMEHEKGNFDRLLFNGDIAHTRKSRKEVSGIRESARFYRSLIENYDVNMGNHELPIMESWRANSVFKTRKNLLNPASGYTKSNSLHFNREMTWELWRKVSLFRVVNGVLVSHAGIGSEDWGIYETTEQILDRIWRDSQQALEEVSTFQHYFFRAGSTRTDGKEKGFGGPLWRDWDTEFTDDLPLKQLVGHTTMTSVVRMKGKSYNIDGGQTVYALINEDGSIDFRGLNKNGPFTPPILKATWTE